uniref:Uncharacterized protein n=1 Tax=Romanomermis culicivorax TaxID=13658 RepID=A0A915JSS1_ROMCU
MLGYAFTGTKASTIFSIIIQIVSCSLYALIYFVNKRYLTDFGLNTARHSLSERFVTWSNVKTSMWLLPVSFMHSLTFTAAMILVNVAMVGYLSSGTGTQVQFNTGYVNFVSLYMAWFALESLIHPILCVKKQ